MHAAVEQDHDHRDHHDSLDCLDRSVTLKVREDLGESGAGEQEEGRRRYRQSLAQPAPDEREREPAGDDQDDIGETHDLVHAQTLVAGVSSYTASRRAVQSP